MTKKILILVAALTVAFFAANAHCYPSYMWSGSTTSVSGSVSSSYTGNKRFQTSSGITVFTTAVNFTGWTRLNFETKTDIKGNINFPTGKGEVGFYGTHKIAYINMTDDDIIYAEGDVTINTLISNNSKPGQWNIVYTDSYVTIAGKKYYPRDTFYSTPGNPETAVIITDCRGTTLPLTLLKYSGRSVGNEIELMWQTVENQPVSVLHSEDGQMWKTISTNTLSPYSFKSNSVYNYVRIMSNDSMYSPTLVFKLSNPLSTDVFDLQGNRLTIEPVNEVYIKEGKKHLILK